LTLGLFVLVMFRKGSSTRSEERAGHVTRTT